MTRSLAFFAALLAPAVLLPLAQAQILSNSLPSCASTCTLLQQAQSSCETNPASAQSCFCQSALLTSINTSGTNICSPGCDAADWATIESWYKTFCAGGGTNAQGVVTASTTTTAAAANGQTIVPGTSTTAAATAAAATTAAGSPDVNQNQTGTEWYAPFFSLRRRVLCETNNCTGGTRTINGSSCCSFSSSHSPPLA